MSRRGRERFGDPLEGEDAPPAGRTWTTEPDSYVIHRHAAWLCLAATFVAGMAVGGALLALGVVLG